jgi:hypothetical protein
VSKGKVKLSFNFNLWFTIIVLIALGISLQFSIIHALCALIFIEIFIIQAMNFHYIMKPCLSLSLKDYIRIVLEVFTPLFLASSLTAIGYHLFSEENLIYQNIVLYLGGIILGMCFFYVLNKDITETLKGKLKEMRLRNIPGKH